MTEFDPSGINQFDASVFLADYSSGSSSSSSIPVRAGSSNGHSFESLSGSSGLLQVTPPQDASSNYAYPTSSSFVPATFLSSSSLFSGTPTPGLSLGDISGSIQHNSSPITGIDGSMIMSILQKSHVSAHVPSQSHVLLSSTSSGGRSETLPVGSSITVKQEPEDPDAPLIVDRRPSRNSGRKHAHGDKRDRVIPQDDSEPGVKSRRPRTGAKRTMPPQIAPLTKEERRKRHNESEKQRRNATNRRGDRNDCLLYYLETVKGYKGVFNDYGVKHVTHIQDSFDNGTYDEVVADLERRISSKKEGEKDLQHNSERRITTPSQDEPFLTAQSEQSPTFSVESIYPTTPLTKNPPPPPQAALLTYPPSQAVSSTLFPYQAVLPTHTHSQALHPTPPQAASKKTWFGLTEDFEH